jgi:glycosyltransferase involved in cell wall biosynthesis
LKISVITPSLNQADFIEKAINSVLCQYYSNFEHIIIDGGSNDNTIDILKKYNHLKWISEKDSGQSNAINKGFKLATGDIICWLNSDDYFDADTFTRVSDYFFEHPDCSILYGDITYVDEKNTIVRRIAGNEISHLTLSIYPDLVRQPSTFWRSSIVNEFGGLNEKLKLVMDLEFFLRISSKYKFHYIAQNLSFFRTYPEGKTFKFQRRQVLEIIIVLLRNNKKIHWTTVKILAKRFLLSFPGFRPFTKI